VGLSVYTPIVAGQQLGKHVPAAKEELLEASFSIRSVTYQKISLLSQSRLVRSPSCLHVSIIVSPHHC
jgi:hypothetical protein